MLPSLLETTESAPPLEGVGFWRRAAARSIDLGLHLLVTMAVGFLVGVLLVVGAAIHGGDPDAAVARISVTTLPGYLVASLGALCMHVCSEGLHGSTIGKRLVGITVVREDGSPAGVGAALRRSVAFYWDSLFFGLVAAQKMAQSPQRQRFGDAWAETVVVPLRSLDEGARRGGLRFVAAATAGVCADGFLVFLELASRLL